MSAEIGEYQANLQKQKSLLNRIERARRGVPTSGGLPFGRTFDKKTETWGVDPVKKSMMAEIAERYIAGESLVHLAAEYGLEHTGLHVNLTQRCGPTWAINFRAPDLNIDEVVTLRIPPLLPDKTITAIHRRVESNKTVSHGSIKHKYLFSRMVFCGHCNGSLSGMHQKGRRYYRHFGKGCLGGNVRADDLEEVVIRHLFDCFGNPKAVQRAIEEATPTREKVEQGRKRIGRIAGELEKIETGRNRILGFIAKGTITDAQAEKQLDELSRKEQRLRDEWERLSERVDNEPTPESIRAVAKGVSAKFRERVDGKQNIKSRRANNAFDEMTWEEKRALAETVFSGKTADGRRMGVYVKRIDGQKKFGPKRWKYTILGHLIEIETGTMTQGTMEAYFGELSGGAGGKWAVSRLGRTCPDR